MSNEVETSGGDFTGPSVDAPSSPGSSFDSGGWSSGGSFQVDYSLGTPANSGVGLKGDLGPAVNADGSFNYGIGSVDNGIGLSWDAGSNSQQLSLSGLTQHGLTQDQLDSWATMGPTMQQSINAKLGLPATSIYNYNHAQPGWREKLTDMTTPGPGLARDFGIRGMGVTPDQYLENETPDQRDRRMELVGNVVGRLGSMLVSAVPGGSLAMTGARMYDAVANKGMPFMDALKAGLFDIGAGKVAGAVNKEFAKAVGPELTGALGVYNNVAGLVNLGAPGTLPSGSPGSYVVGAARDAFGVPSLGRPSGVTSPTTGDPVPGFSADGWSSGGRTSGGADSSPQASVSQQPQTAPSTNVLQEMMTNMRFKFDGAGAGRALRAARAN